MNTYRYTFTATCPNNGQTISYRLEISAHHVIMAEAVVEAASIAAQSSKPYHENIADVLHQRLGGRHRMVAFHHGVEIETTRG